MAALKRLALAVQRPWPPHFKGPESKLRKAFSPGSAHDFGNLPEWNRLHCPPPRLYTKFAEYDRNQAVSYKPQGVRGSDFLKTSHASSPTHTSTAPTAATSTNRCADHMLVTSRLPNTDAK
jgi:hypothetical protein